MPNLTNIGPSLSRLVSTPALPGTEAHSAPSTGSLQGSSVKAHAHAVSLSEPSATRAGRAPSTDLAQRHAEPAAPPPTLARQARLGALPSVNELLGRAGRPKDDISFGLLGTIKQSTGYKQILAGLNQYHDLSGSLANQGVSGSARMQHTMADELLDRLSTLEKAAARYESEGSHGRKEAIGELRAQIGQERMVLQGLRDELRQAGTLPQGASLADAMAFAREGVSLKDMARLMEKGLQPDQAREARELVDSERGASLRDDATRMQPYRDAGFQQGEAYLLEVSGLGVSGGQQYRDLRIPITHEYIVTAATDEHRLGGMSVLGSGAVNEVYAARYGGPDGIENGVFKPLRNGDDNMWVTHRIGIDRDYPCTAIRNLVTLNTSKAMGFDVVVQCQIGSRQPPPPPDKRDIQIGLVMARAPGAPAGETSYMTLRDPAVQREITKLQLLDHVVGQGDRHRFNYFVDNSGSRPTVRGIDNDMCLGKNTRHANDIAKGNDASSQGYNGTKMPPVIDTEMAKGIRSLTPTVVKDLTAHLSADEQSAALARVQSLQQHVDSLETAGRVIPHEDWGQREDLNRLFNAGNSYFARDLLFAVANFY